MKLRIQGNALRLRVTRKEIAELRDRSSVESSMEFGPGRTLTYLLEGSLQAQTVTADFDGGTIRVKVPMRMMTAWIESDQVSIQSPSPAGAELLIEKDFQCLHKSDKQDPDAYPHPLLQPS